MTENSIFETVLGDDWNNLGEAIQQHYLLSPYSNDYICASGVMSEVTHSTIAKLIIPFGRIFGAIVPYRGKNVPVDVHHESSESNSNIHWRRVFKFERGDFCFTTVMEPTKENEVIEFVRFGLGIRLQVSVENDALFFKDTGYVWRVLGRGFSFPGGWIMGNVFVVERPLDERWFSMSMKLTHPLLGDLFGYKGKFEVISDADSRG